MQSTIRVTEYYDVFDVKTPSNNTDRTQVQNTAIPNNVVIDNVTNPFSGFSNWDNFDTNNTVAFNNSVAPNTGTNMIESNVVVTGKFKAPQAINSIEVLDNGDIYCYPPNVGVPYWDRIIFKHFDYMVDVDNASKYKTMVQAHWINKYEQKLSKSDGTAGPNPVTSNIFDYSNVPLFVKFDLYPSRSKVVYSSSDKYNSNNTDIEYRFGAPHGSMSPIKLNLSLSASASVRNTANGDYYNKNLDYTEIQALLSKCYWSIEWIYEPKHGN